MTATVRSGGTASGLLALLLLLLLLLVLLLLLLVLLLLLLLVLQMCAVGVSADVQVAPRSAASASCPLPPLLLPPSPPFPLLAALTTTAAAMMEAELVRNGVDVSGSGRAAMPSGQGLVLLQPGGAATSIVLWGANTAFAKVGWGRGRTCWAAAGNEQ